MQQFDNLTAEEIKTLIEYLRKLEQEKSAPKVIKLGVVKEDLYYTGGNPNIQSKFVTKKELKEHYQAIERSIKKGSEARVWSSSPKRWLVSPGFMIDEKYVQEIVLSEKENVV